MTAVEAGGKRRARTLSVRGDEGVLWQRRTRSVKLAREGNPKNELGKPKKVRKK